MAMRRFVGGPAFGPASNRIREIFVAAGAVVRAEVVNVPVDPPSLADRGRP
jgi:hypothetical protein